LRHATAHLLICVIGGVYLQPVVATQVASEAVMFCVQLVVPRLPTWINELQVVWFPPTVLLVHDSAWGTVTSAAVEACQKVTVSTGTSAAALQFSGKYGSHVTERDDG
jgi:hypothetical protein